MIRIVKGFSGRPYVFYETRGLAAVTMATHRKSVPYRYAFEYRKPLAALQSARIIHFEELVMNPRALASAQQTAQRRLKTLLADAGKAGT
jgi:hypothetical protein